MIRLYVHILSSLFRWLSHIVYYRVLSRVPCALQEVLGGYLFYMQECVSVVLFFFIKIFDVDHF